MAPLAFHFGSSNWGSNPSWRALRDSNSAVQCPICPAQGAMASLIGDFAESERDLIRERVRAGLENARRKGKQPGRRPYFDIASLRTLGRLRDRGMSVRSIARKMKVSKALSTIP